MQSSSGDSFQGGTRLERAEGWTGGGRRGARVILKVGQWLTHSGGAHRTIASAGVEGCGAPTCAWCESRTLGALSPPNTPTTPNLAPWPPMALVPHGHWVSAPESRSRPAVPAGTPHRICSPPEVRASVDCTLALKLACLAPRPQHANQGVGLRCLIRWHADPLLR